MFKILSVKSGTRNPNICTLGETFMKSVTAFKCILYTYAQTTWVSDNRSELEISFSLSYSHSLDHSSQCSRFRWEFLIREERKRKAIPGHAVLLFLSLITRLIRFGNTMHFAWLLVLYYSGRPVKMNQVFCSLKRAFLTVLWSTSFSPFVLAHKGNYSLATAAQITPAFDVNSLDMM
jgi:hypothetical protein